MSNAGGQHSLKETHLGAGFSLQAARLWALVLHVCFDIELKPDSRLCLFTAPHSAVLSPL